MHIVRGVRRSSGVIVLVTALLVVLTVGSSVAAQQTDGTKELQFTQQNNSGVTGTATLRDVEGGLEVTLNMRGLPEAGIEHINHFHGGGSCAGYENGENIPITIPLETIVANEDGTGSATTTLSGVTLDQVLNQDQERIIVLHAEQEEGVPVPPPIACADVNPPAGETTTTTERTVQIETTRPLPESGGTALASPSMLLPAAAMLLGLSVLGFSVLRRR